MCWRQDAWRILPIKRAFDKTVWNQWGPSSKKTLADNLQQEREQETCDNAEYCAGISLQDWLFLRDA